MPLSGVTHGINCPTRRCFQAREDVRLVDRNRGSRTIIASYKNAHSTFCEFVGDEKETAELAAGTRKQLSKAPRFFTPREVARLQGFPEKYLISWVSIPHQSLPLFLDELFVSLVCAVPPGT